jgi:cell division protein FtsB
VNLRRTTVPVLLVVVTIVAVGLFLGSPARAWWSQSDDIGVLESDLETQDARNGELHERIEALGTDEEIERLARERYGLVRPGDESYVVLPPPELSTTEPD